MRIGEAINLNRNDLDANCGVLTMRNGKWLEPHAYHGAVERLAVVGSDYPRQRNDPPPHRPGASQDIACQGISGKGALAQSVALEAAVCQPG